MLEQYFCLEQISDSMEKNTKIYFNETSWNLNKTKDWQIYVENRYKIMNFRFLWKH